jgi:hypothetical protein
MNGFWDVDLLCEQVDQLRAERDALRQILIELINDIFSGGSWSEITDRAKLAVEEAGLEVIE